MPDTIYDDVQRQLNVPLLRWALQNLEQVRPQTDTAAMDRAVAMQAIARMLRECLPPEKEEGEAGLTRQ